MIFAFPVAEAKGRGQFQCAEILCLIHDSGPHGQTETAIGRTSGGGHARLQGLAKGSVIGKAGAIRECRSCCGYDEKGGKTASGSSHCVVPDAPARFFDIVAGEHLEDRTGAQLAPGNVENAE